MIQPHFLHHPFYIRVIHQSYLYEISHSLFLKLVLDHWRKKTRDIHLDWFSSVTSMYWPSIFLRYFPCISFLSHLLGLFPSSYFLKPFGRVKFSLGTVLLFLTTAIKGSIRYSAYRLRLFSSDFPLILHLINLLPPPIARNMQLVHIISGMQFFILC